MSEPTPHRRLDHISTEDVRNCIAGTCDCWHRMSRELSALRLRVEELTHERDQLRDSLRRAVDVADERFAHILESSVEIKDLESIVISHEKRAAEASARIAEEQFRAEKAERELGEARQALRLILMDLPVKRDWLDPNAERIARKIAGASSGHELMRVDGPNEK